MNFSDLVTARYLSHRPIDPARWEAVILKEGETDSFPRAVFRLSHVLAAILGISADQVFAP